MCFIICAERARLCTGEKYLYKFPQSFLFGASTSAYQIEAATNVDGKGESIWDALIETHPELIKDRKSAENGPNSYRFYKQDIHALAEIGFDFYRFSISWPRIMPTGDLASINELGIAYYNRVINELRQHQIEPVIVMYHWDMPLELQKLGGLINPLFIRYFRAYANLLFQRFGDRVKYWITFNQPMEICVGGYGNGNYPPLIKSSIFGGEYLCGHNLLLAHAEAYHLYRSIYAKKFNGQIGISLNTRYFYRQSAVRAHRSRDGHGANEQIEEDDKEDSVRHAMMYFFGWFAQPIFNCRRNGGGYPSIMVDEIGNSSRTEGRPWSRLPTMNAKERALVKGSADFLGLNYYTSRIVERITVPSFEGEKKNSPSWENDAGLNLTVDHNWTKAKSSWIYSVPDGLTDLLKWIRDEYDNPLVLITENGYSDDGELNDYGRIEYLKLHLQAVLRAIYEFDCNVIGHTTWSIIDNFEWHNGLTEKFGLYYVNMTSPLKERHAKMSARFMRDIIKKRYILLNVDGHN